MSLLREALGQRLQSAAVFGSRARGDGRPDSDLDLLIVLTERNATDMPMRLEPSTTPGSGASRK